jgi:hypothetical protein
MADIRITRSAREQIDALNDIDAQAVDAALQVLDTRPGKPINLPGAPAGTSYLAVPAWTQDGSSGPVIAYRPRLPTEGTGWLVLALLSPEQYQDMRRAEELAATTPAVRELIQAIVAGTVSATAHLGTPRRGDRDAKMMPAIPRCARPGQASRDRAGKGSRGRSAAVVRGR